jgi:hypothetical protein
MTDSAESFEMRPSEAITPWAICLILGCVALGVLIWILVIPEWRAAQYFVENTCVILDKRVVVNSDDEDSTYRTDFLIRYTVNDKQYEVWTYKASRLASSGLARHEGTLGQFQVGGQYPCWYDPDVPSTAVLVRGLGWGVYIALLIPLLFIVVGLVGIPYFWMSSHRSRGLPATQISRPGDFTDPSLADELSGALANHLGGVSGGALSHRLVLGTPQDWVAVLGMLFVTLLWNGLLCIIICFAIMGYLDPPPDLLLIIILVPFVAIGLLLFCVLLRSVIVTALCRPATVEISAHPLAPGERAQLYVAQRGPLRLRGLKAIIACDEVATVGAGEDTKTKTKRIHEENLGLRNDAWEQRGSFQIPATARHSFKADLEAINWKVLLKGRVGGWLPIKWDYPIMVRPSRAKESIQ